MRHFAGVVSFFLLGCAVCPAMAGPGSVTVYSNRCLEVGTGQIRGFRLIVVDEGGREISLIYPRSETQSDIRALHYGEWKDFRKGKLEYVADQAEPALAFHGSVTHDAIILAPDGFKIAGISISGPLPVRLPRIKLPEQDPDCAPEAPAR